jgi:hypothetical protein
MHDVDDYAQGQYWIGPVVGVDGNMFFNRSVPIGSVERRPHAADRPGFQVVRTNHRGSTASGRLDALYDQGFLPSALYLEHMRDLRTLNDLAKIMA